jgi:hypothetical protein
MASPPASLNHRPQPQGKHAMTTTNHDAEYQASPFFDDDAIDALATTEHRPEWLMPSIRSWYVRSSKYATVIEDAIDNEREWT